MGIDLTSLSLRLSNFPGSLWANTISAANVFDLVNLQLANVDDGEATLNRKIKAQERDAIMLTGVCWSGTKKTKIKLWLF